MYVLVGLAFNLRRYLEERERSLSMPMRVRRDMVPAIVG